MTDERETQEKQCNSGFFPESMQPTEQPEQENSKFHRYDTPQTNNLKTALREILIAEKSTLETLQIMARPNEKELAAELSELEDNLRRINAALEVNDFAAFPAVSGNSFLNITYNLLEWHDNKEREFLSSSDWDRLKENFPGITENQGTELYFCGYVKPILENISEFKNKIVDYEKKNSCSLSFADLIDTDKEKLQDGLTLAERFLNEIGEKKDDKILRTAATAGNVQQIRNINRLAIPTAAEYLYACSMLEQGNAYMKQINMDGLTFNNGKLYFKDYRAREVSEMELQDLKTKENIEKINLPFLQFLYTILFKEWEKSIQDQANGKPGEIPPVSKFYLPDILKARGISSNAGQTSIDAIKNDISALHNVVGVLKVKGYKNPSYYPVLLFEGYDTATNTISISSPYLLHVVKEIYSFSVRRTKDGEPRLRKDGTPQRIAVNSYLIHSDITKERNKAAVQNVFLLVQSIENRGGERGKLNEFSISAESLIERNPLLKYQLTKKNPAQTLKRCFVKTWELLEAETDLKEKYINIKLPDPRNPADIPTLKGLSDHVIKITHYGKANSQEADCNTKTQ